MKGRQMSMKPFDYRDFDALALALPDEINFLRCSGDFEGELRAIEAYLARPGVSRAMQQRLWFERVIAEGMLEDYTDNTEQFLAALRRSYPSSDERTVEQLLQSGHLDTILVCGERRYQNAAVSNVLSRCRKLLQLQEYPDKPFVYDLDDERRENMRLMREKGSRSFRYHVRFSLSVDEEARRADKKLRVWLPAPAACVEQSDIRILASSAPVSISDALQPTVYFETMDSSEKFFVEYSYVQTARYHHLDDAAVSADQPHFDTEEFLPHIQFTPVIRALAAELKGSETNPLRIARRFFEYITRNVRYSYMREYLLLDNISQFCAVNGRGDCGVQALLFIALCRCVGIPARWQSGNTVKPTGYFGSHDWAMFYVAPYGWLYADPSVGGGALREGDAELCDFYFGNLDPFRMVCATDVQQPFSPVKTFLRDDPYDNQSGEAEYEDAPLHYSELTRHKRLLLAEEL
jgi:hypothetical protein